MVRVDRSRLGPHLPVGTQGDARPDALIHLYVSDIDTVATELGVQVDEEGLAGRECDVSDPDGNRLRIATPRS